MMIKGGFFCSRNQKVKESAQRFAYKSRIPCALILKRFYFSVMMDMKQRISKTLFIISCVIIPCLFATAVFAERVSVAVSNANVRTGPGTNYGIAWENLDKNYPLEVIDKKGDWLYVKDYEGDVGWIYKTIVGSWDSVITRTNDCNVRSGPGTGFDVVFVVDNGVPFKVVERKGDWINIRHSDGDTGWIYKNLVW